MTLLAPSLTLGADLADFLHVVFGAVVDGVRDASLGDGLVLGGGRRAEHGDVLHGLAQLGDGDADATWGVNQPHDERSSRCRRLTFPR